jgi:hypothetical protein
VCEVVGLGGAGVAESDGLGAVGSLERPGALHRPSGEEALDVVTQHQFGGPSHEPALEGVGLLAR